MYYRDLFTYYLAKGGDTSRETSFGDRNWDDVVDPEMQTRLEVVFNHDTGDVRAVRPDRTIILVGNITARWGHEESIRWFREPNRGDWPPRYAPPLERGLGIRVHTFKRGLIVKSPFWRHRTEKALRHA